MIRNSFFYYFSTSWLYPIVALASPVSTVTYSPIIRPPNLNPPLCVLPPTEYTPAALSLLRDADQCNPYFGNLPPTICPT